MAGKEPSVYRNLYRWVRAQDQNGNLWYDPTNKTWSCRLFGHLRTFQSDGAGRIPELDRLHPLKPGRSGRSFDDYRAGPLIPEALERFAQTFRDGRP